MKLTIENFSREVFNELLEYGKSLGYQIFEGGEYNLNIWVIRVDHKINKFNDIELVFFKNDDCDDWIYYTFSCTSKPGLHYLLNPINSKGTAIVKPGQYRSVWRLGYHKGNLDHPALIQHKPITLIRDSNRNDKLDTVGMYEQTGYFGINNHRASLNKITRYVNKYSAGCIVQNNPIRYSTFISLIKKQTTSTFSLTLIDYLKFQEYLLNK